MGEGMDTGRQVDRLGDAEGEALIEGIRSSIIGRDHELEGPFGPRMVSYADYTASGRSLEMIEGLLREHVMPYYANTHTESSGTGLQTTRFREDARAIIHRAVGGSEEDVVLFCGSGATGAINRLLDILNLRIPADLDDTYGLSQHIPREARPVVFIGPYEHHSNELPWRESIAEVVVIDEDENGRVSLPLLEEALTQYKDRPLLIGSFSAASNVTGIGSKTGEISALLHRYGALSFWDFAAAGPYVPIEMNGVGGDPMAYKDALFLSPHKFIGGPGTPGILVVKRKLLTNRVPSVPGGGTVAYVGPTEHRYLTDPIHREEGGTPEILGAIRAGLVFQLKEAVGASRIRAREESFVRRAIERWEEDPRIRILGNHGAWRLSIVSFMVRHLDPASSGAKPEQEGRYLHHNFVVTLLNDLFGIQARGGCSCAGPYGHRLLGIDLVRSKEYQREILRGCEGIKPGWSRINFNYFISEAMFDFLIEAVRFVATDGWRFLPLYHFSPDSGLWHHRDWKHQARMRLTDVRYRWGRLVFPHHHRRAGESAFASYLEQARELAASLPEAAGEPEHAGETNADFESLRWFPLPEDIRACAGRASAPSASSEITAG